MISTFRKALYILYKKDICVLCAILCILHLFLAPWAFYFSYDFVTCYHLCAALFTVLMILYSRTNSPYAMFMLMDVETMVYGFVMTAKYGSPMGAEILSIGIMSYLFVLVIISNKKSMSAILPITITTNAVIIMLAFKYKNSLSTATPVPDLFYTVHNTACSLAGLLSILFAAMQTRQKIKRYHLKTKNRENYLIFSANHDALTKILNRRKFISILREYQSNDAHKNSDFAIAIFDIDGFKKINDIQGHDCGDLILHDMAQLIKQHLPKTTVFARWGGEEFIIFFTSNVKTAHRVLEDIRSTVDLHPFIFNKKPVKVSITIGLSNPGNPDTFAMQLIEADKNLMYGKQNGKNQVVTTGDTK
ncbi:MAG: GGDEF domain-containing protein [Treponema sp.]|nr:GGDEF domain-containing protein [Treponema sp.]